MEVTRRASVGLIATALALPGQAYAVTGTITSFTIANWSSSSSKCRYRRALWFAKGHIPAGYVPVIRQGTTIIQAQFDERKTWSDGSLQLCVLSMMDNDFAGLESRVYAVSATTGSYSNAGLRALSDVTSRHDFKVGFAGVTQFNGSTTVTRGSGAFTADFNVQSKVATRVYNYHSGPVCSSWEVWGMATDNSGGAQDPHLKTVWYVTAWNNPDGTLNDVEYAAVVTQDWWNVAGKFRLNYNATLMDGTATINTYLTVQHPYHSQWMTVRTANDNNHARRFWAGAIPTLSHTFDKNYARSTGLFPYLDPVYQPTSLATILSTGGCTLANYVPISPENHRGGIDQTGGYMGRGLMPNTDCVAWMRQTPADYRYARTNGFAGLHVPYHYRSNATRKIASGPQAGTDTANTVVSMIMRPLAASQYDFTAQGMPAPIDAYTGVCTGQIAATFVPKTGGNGPWSPSGDASHAVAYSYGMYLLEGERHFMQATLDLATNAAHQLNGNSYGGAPQASYYGCAPFQTLLAIPNTQWSGISNARPEARNIRNAGWGMMLAAQAGIVCPDVDVQSGFIKLFRKQHSAYVAWNMGYMEPAQLALGIYSCLPAANYMNSPWEGDFLVLSHSLNAIANEDQNSLTAINNCLQYQAMAPWKSGQGYRSNDYCELVSLRTQTPYNRVTNPLLSLSAQQLQSDCSVTSNVITTTEARITPSNGDVVYFSRTNCEILVAALPSGFAEATPYYAVNCSAFKLQLSATPGGPALAIPNGTYSIGYQPAMWNRTVASSAVYLPPADSYPSISAAALIMASKAGANAVTSGMVASAQAFVAPINTSTWVTWRITP
jgi:hypothetical protein